MKKYLLLICGLTAGVEAPGRRRGKEERTQCFQHPVDQDRERVAASNTHLITGEKRFDEVRNRLLYASHVVDELRKGRKFNEMKKEKHKQHRLIAEDVKNKFLEKLGSALSSTKKWLSAAYKPLTAEECQSAYKRLKDFYCESIIFNVLKDDRESKKVLVDELRSLSEEAREGPLARSSLAVAHALIFAHYHIDVHGMSIEESIDGILHYYESSPATQSSNSSTPQLGAESHAAESSPSNPQLAPMPSCAPHVIDVRMQYAFCAVGRFCHGEHFDEMKKEKHDVIAEDVKNKFLEKLETALSSAEKPSSEECESAYKRLMDILADSATFNTDGESKKRLVDELSSLSKEARKGPLARSSLAVAHALIFAHYHVDVHGMSIGHSIDGILGYCDSSPATQSSNFSTPQLGAESHPAHGIEVRMVYALDVVSRVCHGGCYRTSCASLLLEKHRLFDRQFIVDLRHLLDATESVSSEECQLAVDQLRRIIKAQSTTFFETDEGKREEARKSLLDELSTLKTELSEAHGRDWRFSLIAVAHALTFAHGVDVSEGPLEDSINGILEFYEAPTQSSQISRSLTELSRRPKSQKRKVRRKKHRGGLRQHMKRRRSRRRNSKQAAK